MYTESVRLGMNFPWDQITLEGNTGPVLAVCRLVPIKLLGDQRYIPHPHGTILRLFGREVAVEAIERVVYSVGWHALLAAYAMGGASAAYVLMEPYK